MNSAQTLRALMDDRNGLHCLPAFTKQWLASELRGRSIDWLDRYIDERIGFLQRFIEPLSRCPDIPDQHPALQDIDIPADTIITIPHRVRHRGAGLFRDPRDFALCCTELAPLKTVNELTLALGVAVPDQMLPNSWLDWAIEVQKAEDFVSALYCMASFWAMPATRDDLHGDWLRIEADAIGVTGMALMIMFGSNAALDVLEHWIDFSLRDQIPAFQMRRAVQASPISRIDYGDTSAQLVSKAIVALLAWENPAASRAIALLEAWLDIPLSEIDDATQLAELIRRSALHRVNSPRVVQHLRSQISEVIEKAVGPRAKGVFLEAWHNSFSPISPIEMPAAPGGDYSPALLHLHVAMTGDPDTNKEELGAAFAHEYQHFLQSISTTYNQDRLFDVLNLAAAVVKYLGGDETRMVHGLSDVNRDFIEHLRFHRHSLDGDYPSHAVTEYHGGPSAGWLQFNEETLCYEYVRYNIDGRTFFATPLGAHAFQEALVFINQQFAGRYLPHGTVVVAPDSDPVESATHAYMAPWDLFFRAVEDHPANAEVKAATLAAILDFSLHLPDPSDDPSPESRMATIPTFRFVHLFEAVRESEFVDPNLPGDYERFIEELCGILGWPSFTSEVTRRADKLAKILDHYRKQAEQMRRAHPTMMEAAILSRLRGVEQALRTRGSTDAQIKRELSDFEQALRGNPLVVLEVFGLGIIDYCERALRLRLDHPWDVILPARAPERTLQELPIPAWFLGDEMRGAWDVRSLTMLEDIVNLRHLYAIGVQWETKAPQQQVSSEYMCGFKYFGLECPDPICNTSGGPLWRPGTGKPDIMCGFSHTLRARGLFTN